jgi:hypothetical protein
MSVVSLLIAVIVSFCLGYLLHEILSSRQVDGFCFLHKEGSKDQLIFNLFGEPESILDQKMVKFKVMKLEEEASNDFNQQNI